MRKDARVRYEWSSAGGLVNFDTHGDPVNAPQGFYHGYGKGRGATNDTGALVAAFDGKHGWFWRNRSSSGDNHHAEDLGRLRADQAGDLK